MFEESDLKILKTKLYEIINKRSDLFYQFSILSKTNRENFVKTLEVLENDKTKDTSFLKEISLDQNDLNYILGIFSPLRFPMQYHLRLKKVPQSIWNKLKIAFSNK
ncbi:hypothetical protein HE1_01097 [Holospora elegans E1]|uniref:Uncharacterized protein n=1 Tax=Holospora elegans E1 TaxID=1427503 RepID=A0A023E010_9PROT|nr:hypothetical protein HE1_01097 [Holospora elegans E1]